MTAFTPLSLRLLFRTDWQWLALLAFFPAFYLGVLVLPPPFGLGMDFGNDFSDHRIGWVQMDAFWISHGQVPLWNPIGQFGGIHFGLRGMAWFYPVRWWLYFPAIWAPSLNYASQYLQIIAHMAVALWGVFFLLRRHTAASPGAAVFATLPFLLNQRFTDFVRYPQGIEAITWIPWILLAALECCRAGASATERKLWAWRLALGTALTLLAGYAHLSYMGALLCGVVLVCAARSGLGLVLAAGGAFVGLVAAAGSLYPVTLQAATMVGRKGNDPAWANLFLPPHHADMWIRPFAAELHGSAFFPTVFVFLALLGIIIALIHRRSGVTIGMLAALLLIGDLSRGSDGFSFGWFYDHAPMFHVFRIQGRNFWPALIAVAFFSAQALAWLENHPKRAVIHLLVISLLTAGVLVIAWRADGPAVLPDRIPGYSALGNQWIAPMNARWAYAAILGCGVIALGFLALGKGCRCEGAGSLLMVAIFSLAHAQFNTWFVTDRPAHTLVGTSAAYPHGVLQSYQEEPHQGILAVLGAEETTRKKFDLYRLLQPTPDALFPASRFYFIPAGSNRKVASRLRLRGYDANHVDFEVSSEGPGRLVYFATPHALWKSNHPIHPWPSSEPLFMSFEISAGVTSISLRFTPWKILLTGSLSLCATAWLVIQAAGAGINSRLAWITVAFATTLVGFLLTGTLLRHDLEAHVLAGPSGGEVFQWQDLPVGDPHP